MVTHFKIDGHLACGREGKKLKTTTASGRVTCRNCRHTDAYVMARESVAGASLVDAPVHGDWRSGWRDKLVAIPGANRLPRGFAGQIFV